ncbi:uncharacterized protein LOC133828118 [Humulus lupulus]|uniref:uncharacterized protein LOC133828118 n=1 Tax=Humulus lupulus TaxID=3486 RepID=UPI002B401FC7|nr:uncharacterized protein LOC133828118 [Humulus lupulus]
MVKTHGASSKKTPASQSRKVPSPSPPPSVSMAPPSVIAPATSVGKTSKSKVRKKVFSLSTEHPMVFPDITANIVDVAPPSEVVVPSRAKNLSPLPIESSLTARAKSKSVSSSSKAAAAAGLLKLPMKPSQSKKNYVAPKRKFGLDSSSFRLTAANKRLKAHPPSPSSSESDPEEAKSKSEAIHDTTLSEESVLDNAESVILFYNAESDEPEQEDIFFFEQEVESDMEPVATPLSSKAKGKRPISDSTPSPKLSGSLVKFTGFVDRIVKEFYANLTNEIIEPKSPLYCKVFVRGHWFSFSPQDIAHALHLPLDVEDDDDPASLDKDAAITELVGQKMVCPSNTVISVTNLTYTYVVLHKFATTNWKPTSHTATISFDMASFLYNVGTGIDINLAIYQIIGFQKEDLVAPTTAASYKAYAPPTEATDAPSTRKSSPNL